MEMLPVKDATSCIKMQCKTMYKGACVNQPVDFENSLDTDVGKSLWRNRLARSAVNRKVGGSSPPRDVILFLLWNYSRPYFAIPKKKDT